MYYDPQDPRSAVLERGASKKTYLILVFGLGFSFFSAWLYPVLWLFQRRVSKKSHLIVVFGLGFASFAAWFYLVVWLFEN